VAAHQPGKPEAATGITPHRRSTTIIPDAPDQQNPETWLAARLAAGLPAERWKPLPGWPHTVSDQGLVQTVKGRLLVCRPNNSGYLLYDLWNPHTRQKRTVTGQWCVLTAHRGERPEGQEARHLHGHPEWNWYPENLTWGTKAENHADKDDPQPPKPTYPCLNAPRGCDGKALNPGRRCVRCTAEVGAEAAAMLRAGENLETVRQHFGYKTGDWVFGLAVRYGGYPAELKDQARTQQPKPRGLRGVIARWAGVA
jgi:hypothetical protein